MSSFFAASLRSQLGGSLKDDDFENFCNPDQDENVHLVCLNRIVMHTHREKDIQGLIVKMQAQFTSLDEGVRGRAALLFAQVLQKLPELPLNTSTLHFLIEFLSSRLSDFPRFDCFLCSGIGILTFHLAALGLLWWLSLLSLSTMAKKLMRKTSQFSSKPFLMSFISLPSPSLYARRHSCFYAVCNCIHTLWQHSREQMEWMRLHWG